LYVPPITVEDVLNSRMIAYPFRLLQCCLVTDGGAPILAIINVLSCSTRPSRSISVDAAADDIRTRRALDRKPCLRGFATR